MTGVSREGAVAADVAGVGNARLWVNGAPADPARAQLSAFDRGFTLADALFETVRIYAGRPFRLDQHLARLRRGAGVLGIALPDGMDDSIRRAACESAASGFDEASLRVTVSRGIGAPGLAPPADASAPTVIIAAQRLASPLSPRGRELGLAAITARGRRDERAATSGVKVVAYTEAVVALADARRAGADEALFLDTAGHLAEGSASNLFLVISGRLATPPLSCGLLAGITRATVLELADALNIAADERILGPEALAEADEAFLTSSIREVVPLVRVDGRAIGSGAPGPVTRRIAEHYEELARTECGA